MRLKCISQSQPHVPVVTRSASAAAHIFATLPARAGTLFPRSDGGQASHDCKARRPSRSLSRDDRDLAPPSTPSDATEARAGRLATTFENQTCTCDSAYWIS